MFAMILAGWWISSRGWLGKGAGAILSRLVVDAAFPALVFTQMIRTVDAVSLRAGWSLPFLLALLVGVSSLAGFALAPLFSRSESRRTFVFLVAIPNWVYLPLPIVAALFGDPGVSAVLLGNVGAQVVLWSYGVWLLKGGLRGAEVAKSIAFNPGLLATAAGILIALAMPGAKHLLITDRMPAGALELIGSVVLQAVDMLGSLTIPMSLLVIGHQLGNLRVGPPGRALWGVLIGRLAVAPVLWLGLGMAARLAGVEMPDLNVLVLALVSLMPVALSCSVFTERFGGDSDLAAQAIFWSTLASLATVPLGFAIVTRFVG